MMVINRLIETIPDISKPVRSRFYRWLARYATEKKGTDISFDADRWAFLFDASTSDSDVGEIHRSLGAMSVLPAFGGTCLLLYVQALQPLMGALAAVLTLIVAWGTLTATTDVGDLKTQSI